jgi:hypothetical protein
MHCVYLTIKTGRNPACPARLPTQSQGTRATFLKVDAGGIVPGLSVPETREKEPRRRFYPEFKHTPMYHQPETVRLKYECVQICRGRGKKLDVLNTPNKVSPATVDLIGRFCTRSMTAQGRLCTRKSSDQSINLGLMDASCRLPRKKTLIFRTLAFERKRERGSTIDCVGACFRTGRRRFTWRRRLATPTE